MSTLLEAIVARKRREVEVARERVPTMALEGRLAVASPVRDFFAAVSAPGAIRLIAEFKRKSPSAGEIRPGATVEEIVRGYAAAGAAALSVLTDAVSFGGSLVDLESARVAVPLPVLRKEFVVDRYQVLEARAHGADAVLLIAECLDDCHLRSLYREILDLGMTPLVELHSEEHLDRVLDIGATLIGILKDHQARGGLTNIQKPSWAAGELMGMIEHPVFFVPMVTGDEVKATALAERYGITSTRAAEVHAMRQERAERINRQRFPGWVSGA
jgi:indole-3-glycerol phosphate synthase